MHICVRVGLDKCRCGTDEDRWCLPQSLYLFLWGRISLWTEASWFFCQTGSQKIPGISVFLSSLWVWVSDALGVGSSYVDAGKLSLAFIIVQQVCLTAEPSLKPYDLFPFNTESRKIETAYVVLAVLVLHSADQEVQINCTAFCWSVRNAQWERGNGGIPVLNLISALSFFFFFDVCLAHFVLICFEMWSLVAQEL